MFDTCTAGIPLSPTCWPLCDSPQVHEAPEGNLRPKWLVPQSFGSDTGFVNFIALSPPEI